MSFGNTFETDLLELIFNATAISNIADDAGTSPLTNLWVSLHTGDVGESGDQTTNEATYTSYARVSVARTSGGWTVSGNSVSPASNIDFPEATGGTETITHFAIGTDETSTGKVLAYGSISPTISVSTGVIPRITTSSTLTLD